ncbi:DUF6414 family protein [Carnobacterium mobile]|uniref:DUF6414 family protein n=1 Tax=Carnobacterium mobile TaxID=2750 RepID=UPI003CC7E81C
MSSFMSIIKKNKSVIVSLTDIKLFIYKDSPAYYRNLVPIMHMIDDVNKVQSLSEEDRKNFSGFNIQALGKTLDLLSGYYDFICENKEGEKMIVRFNITGLRNNYNLNDLTKMNLKLFGIKVGETQDANLEFGNQIDNMTQELSNEKVGVDFDEEEEQNNSNYSLPIIDILLAGV